MWSGGRAWRGGERVGGSHNPALPPTHHLKNGLHCGGWGGEGDAGGGGGPGDDRGGGGGEAWRRGEVIEGRVAWPWGGGGRADVGESCPHS